MAQKAAPLNPGNCRCLQMKHCQANSGTGTVLCPGCRRDLWQDKIFNASTCGDNCAKWLLKIAESEDRTINLRHLMNFGKDPFVIRILNTGEIVHSMEELVSIAGEFV